MQNMKTIQQRLLQPRGWQKKKNISVWEAERQLDTDIYLTEHQPWVPFGLHHNFLLHGMFVHAVATGQKEHDCAICCGRWEPLPVQDLEAEPSVVELIYANAMREEIAEIYHDVYQLWWLLGKLPCDAEMEDHLCQEILDSIKECFWHEQDPTLLEERLSWCPTSTPRPTTVAKTMLIMTSSKAQCGIPVKRP